MVLGGAATALRSRDFSRWATPTKECFFALGSLIFVRSGTPPKSRAVQSMVLPEPGRPTLGPMLGAALVVVIVGSAPPQPVTTAFEAAARGVLGADAKLEIIGLEVAPSDDEAVARAQAVDGVVELIWTKDGAKTRLHCYVSREQRWVDREISFGANEVRSTRDASERGRLLGYAVATMFADESALEPARETKRPPPQAPPTPANQPEITRPAPASGELNQPTLARRALEFYGMASSGLGGIASGLGAAAGIRGSLSGVLSARLFVAGRAGSITQAQTTTRDAYFGAGLAVAVPFRERQFELGLRSDLFVSYFDATHLSEDDVSPDRRSRWLPGTDIIAEGGFRFAESAGVFAGVGGEAVFGKTDLYTHGQRVAVVPALRAVGELGFRIGF